MEQGKKPTCLTLETQSAWMSHTSNLWAFQSQIMTAPKRSTINQWGSSCWLPKTVIVGLLLWPSHAVLGIEFEPWAFGMPTAYSLCPRTLVSSSLNVPGAGKIAQLVGALAIKPDNLSSIPGSCKTEGGN